MASDSAHGDDAATRAERLFDSLLEHAVAVRNGRPVVAAEAQPVVWSPPPPATVPAQPAPAATNGDLGGADPIGTPKDTTAAEVLVLCQAMEQALEAINRRLTSIEHLLLGEPGPNDGSADPTMARLRPTLLRSAGGAASTAASLPEVEEEAPSVPDVLVEEEAPSVPEVEVEEEAPSVPDVVVLEEVEEDEAPSVPEVEVGGA